MISEEDRALAEETFDYIERSETSGNGYEANLPIGGDAEPEFLSAEWFDAYVCTACDLDADPGTGPLGHTYPHTCQPVTLADHTDSAVRQILGQ